MKKIRFIFIVFLLIIAGVSYSYEIGRTLDSSFDKREDSTQRWFLFPTLGKTVKMIDKTRGSLFWPQRILP